MRVVAMLVLLAPAVALPAANDVAEAAPGPASRKGALRQVWQRTFPRMYDPRVHGSNGKLLVYSLSAPEALRPEKPFVAVDLATGKDVWRSEFGPAASEADGSRYYAFSRKGSHSQIHGVAWHSGRQLWSAPAYSVQGDAFAAGHGRVVWRARENEVVAAEGATGREVWRHQESGAPLTLSPLLVADDRVYALRSGGTAPQLLRLDLEKGATLAKAPLEGLGEFNYTIPRMLWSPEHQRFYLAEQGAGAGVDLFHLRALDVALREAWKRAHTSDPYPVDGTLVCVTWKDVWNHQEGLVGLDPVTGEERWKRAVAPNTRERILGPWGGQIVTARRPTSELGAGGLLIGRRPRDGQVLWSQPLPNATQDVRVYGRWILVSVLGTNGHPARLLAYGTGRVSEPRAGRRERRPLRRPHATHLAPDAGW